MDSLDAQCLVMQTTEGKIRAPDIWCHERSGALSCSYEDGTQVFTWPPEAVAEMAQQWRDSDTTKAPEQARLFADAGRRLDVLIREAGLRPADTVFFHLGLGELKAIWEREEVVVTVEAIGQGGAGYESEPA
jgi:hypothetical protein